MLQTSLALVVFLFPLAYSPGPGNMVFAANGARFGVRATGVASVGYHVATWFVTVAIGVGFMATLDEAPQMFAVLRVVGSAYVVWIAWKMVRAGALTTEGAVRPLGFRDGVFLLILNPKAYIIIALMFSQFLTASDGGLWPQVLLIATVFTGNNLIAFTVWTLAGDRLAGRYRTPKSARALNLLFGGILAAVAGWMLLS